MMKEHSSATDAKMMKESKSMKPKNCPAGTEPQDNGTCMLK